MAKNRVDQAYVEVLSSFANAYWEDALAEAKTAFEQPPPKPTDKDYWKALTFQHNAKQRLLNTIEELARMKSGAIHPTGQNTTAERAGAAKWIMDAQAELGLPTAADEENADAG